MPNCSGICDGVLTLIPIAIGIFRRMNAKHETLVIENPLLCIRATVIRFI